MCLGTSIGSVLLSQLATVWRIIIWCVGLWSVLMASSSNRWLLQGSIGRTGLTHDFFHLPAAFKKSFLNVALYSSLYSSYCVANTSTETLLDLNCNKIQMFIFCLLLSSQSGRQLRYRWLDPARCTTVRRTAAVRHTTSLGISFITMCRIYVPLYN